MRHFNTAGPVRESRHYCVPPLSRVDLDDVLTLVRQEQYFVLHAPRQTGKTSTLLALREVLNGGAAGDYPLRVRQRRGGAGCARGHRPCRREAPYGPEVRLSARAPARML